MPLDPESFSQSLRGQVLALGPPERCIVAFSGGRDSTVLLWLMTQVAPALDIPLLAVHINHQLQPQAADWQAHCATQAARMSVEFQSIKVSVASSGGAGQEGNARVARYAALEGLLGEQDWLLTAHHEDDQAETLLLNLLRGSGVAGLRGIAPQRPLARGHLLRPLLTCSAADIEAYGRAQELEWIDDPSNENTDFDRNFLRADVLPLLSGRWPAATRQLARSAELAAEASALVDELAGIDLAQCGPANRLSVAGLQALTVPRRANVLRFACRTLGLPVPPHRQLHAMLTELLPARPDAAPLVQWDRAEARRYREYLYLAEALADEPLALSSQLVPGSDLSLGAGLGSLTLQETAAAGIAPEVVAAGLTVQCRKGGEVLRPAGRGTGKTLKKLLQEAGVVPWMRARLPLLYRADALVAVADLWVAEEFSASNGYRVVWDNKPAIF